jgi:HK97 family phage major capsid protein
MAKLPSYARAGAVWLGSPASDDGIFSRLMAAGGGNTLVTLQGSTGMTYLGKRREVSEYMPSDASADLSNKVIVLYGDFKKACFLGDRRGITIQVLRELYAVNGQIAVLGTERFDFNCQFAVGDTSNAGSVCALIGGAS